MKVIKLADQLRLILGIILLITNWTQADSTDQNTKKALVDCVQNCDYGFMSCEANCDQSPFNYCRMNCANNQLYCERHCYVKILKPFAIHL